MSALFQRHNFLWASLNLPFVVEAKIGPAQITLRTWRLSQDAPLAAVLPADEAAALYGGHTEAFAIDADLAPSREIRQKHWIPLAALGGQYAGAPRSRNLFLQPVSQVGFRIDPAVLGSAAWSDYAVWSFNAGSDGRLAMPFNRYLATQPSREHRYALTMARQEETLLTLVVPFAQQDFSTCAFILKYNAALGCIHNFAANRVMPVVGPGAPPPDHEQLYGVKALLPSLRLIGPDTIPAGQAADYAVEIYSRNTDMLVDDTEVQVYLESSCGYLPRRRVTLSNGSAGFPLMALGLTAGDQIKLKVGWRNYSGVDEKIVTIV
jgi:hypothetical protein